MGENHVQMSLFEALYDKPTLPRHIRLIEFFAGIGAQAKALEILGADFEHWKTCEWSWQSITAYNAIHMGGKVEDTSNLSYEEVLERINGVSADYNKPMTDKQLRAKGEKWARGLLGRMIANKNTCPNISNLKAEDLNIRQRERVILTASHIRSLAKTCRTRVLCKAWKEAVEHAADCCGRSNASCSNVRSSAASPKSLSWKTYLACADPRTLARGTTG